MYKTALALASATVMLTATAAAAEEPPPPEPFVFNACGSTLTLEEVSAHFSERPGETTFAASGNYVLRISDGDSSVVVRVPGLIKVEGTDTSSTFTQTGRNLLIPDPAFPYQAEAIASAGLPELPLIIGRVVVTETLDPVTGAVTDAEVSFDGRVVDVCELLAR